jgi:acetyl-CoA C-acetyltransferase
VAQNVDPQIDGVGIVPNGSYSVPERDLALTVVREAIEESGVNLATIDGIYMPSPRAWTLQGFFSTYLIHLLGLDISESVEVSTGGTSGSHAFHTAVSDIREGTIDAALVLAVERNSTIETTGPYFEYISRLFDAEFESPIGMTIPGCYAQSMQRYIYEYGVEREHMADIVVKNRANAVNNPDTLFDDTLTREDVLSSHAISDPITLYECPAPCDGAAALVVTNGHVHSESSTVDPVTITGVGSHHAPSHLLMTRHDSITEFPAVAGATQAAVDDAKISLDQVDMFEPYAPFPHIEAIIIEELGLAERGAGVDMCLSDATAPDGEIPVSPSGGCLGRGHPPMVTPLFNYVEAVRQLRGTATQQVASPTTALTTAEHGHVNGVTATVLSGEM